jgi:peptide/nickel transport system ATP-binding protein
VNGGAQPALLEVTGLRTRVSGAEGNVEAVRGVDLTVRHGETVAIAGESGSGKSLTVMSIAGLLPAYASVTGGSIRLEGEDLLSLPPDRMRQVHGDRIGVIYQDSLTALNPMMHVGMQVRETLMAHGWKRADANRRVSEVLRDVGIPESLRRLYPHQLSGGMRQRVLIACAVAGRPGLLIADEATTALDVTIQQQILRLVRRLARDYGMSVLWVTHDLGVVAAIADRVAVMYAGRVIELTGTERLFRSPSHPYTAGLLRSLPSLEHPHQEPLPQIGGIAAVLSQLPPGCPFGPRCPAHRARCDTDEPPLHHLGETAAACWFPVDMDQAGPDAATGVRA